MTDHNSCDHRALELQRDRDKEYKPTISFLLLRQISAAARNSKADFKNKIKSPVGEIHSVSVEDTRLELLAAGALALPHTHSCALSHKFTHSTSLAHMCTICSCSRQTLWFKLQVLCPVSLRKTHIKSVFTCVTQARLVCWGTLSSWKTVKRFTTPSESPCHEY